MRSRAVQAFWAMHVEVLNWSGMSARDYANALLLSPWALRKWRARLDDAGETDADGANERARAECTARWIAVGARDYIVDLPTKINGRRNDDQTLCGPNAARFP